MVEQTTREIQLEEQNRRLKARLDQYKELIDVVEKQLKTAIYNEEELGPLYRANYREAVQLHLDRFKRKAGSLLAVIRMVKLSER